MFAKESERVHPVALGNQSKHYWSDLNCSENVSRSYQMSVVIITTQKKDKVIISRHLFDRQD